MPKKPPPEGKQTSETAAPDTEAQATPPRGVVNRDFIRLFLGFHFFMLNVSIFNLLPHYLELRGASEALYGAVAGTAGWANLFFALLLAYRADYWSRKATVMFYLFVALCGNAVALLAMSRGIEWFFPSRALHGIAMALGMPIIFAWTIEVSPLHRRKEGLAWLGIAGLSANSLGPLIGELILSMQPQPVSAGSYSLVFLTATVFQGVALAIFLTTRNRWAVAEEEGAGRGLASILFRRESFPVLLIGVSFGGVFGVLMSFGKNYTSALGLAYASVLFSSYSIGAIISRIFITPLTTYLTPRHMIPFGLLGIGISQFMLSWAQGYPLLGGGGLVYGLSHGILYPTLFMRFLEFQRPSEFGRAAILFQGSFSGGWGLFPVVGGLMVQSTGFPALFSVLGAVTGVAILLHLRTERLTRQALVKQ
ncbi:MAG: MFS transporter [bacterium]